MTTKTSKKRRGARGVGGRRSVVNPLAPKMVKGATISLAGDTYGSATINIKGGKAKQIAQRINEGMKSGKLIEVGGKWIAPAHVIGVSDNQWQDYGR